MAYMDLHSDNLDLLWRTPVRQNLRLTMDIIKCLHLNKQHCHNLGEMILFLRDTEKTK